MRRDLLVVSGIGAGIWLTFGPNAASAVFFVLILLLAVLDGP